MKDLAPLRRALFEPDAVAIIGASDEAGKISARPVEFLIRHGFKGEIFPINPRRETVLGRKSYPDLAALPRKVDQAYVVLPTDAAMAAVEDCVRHGVRAVSILADGFAEAGAAGFARQKTLLDMIAGTETRLLGPNSLGLLRTWNGLSMTANAAFAHDNIAPGRYTVLSQSGSLIGTFFSRGRPRGIGFSNLVSVGNEADLSIGEIGECLVDDPDTNVFLLFLETIRHAHTLASFARAANKAGKPIVAYKLGRSEIGAELAVSHTGALVGSDVAADAFLRDLGISRVGVFEALLEAPPLLRSRRPADKKPTVTMLTTTGGGGAMVADQLGVFGIEMQEIDEASRSNLKKQGIDIKPGRLVDLTLAGTRYKTVRAIIDELLTSPEVGVLVSVIGSSAEFFPEQTVAPIIDAVKAAKRGHPPVAVYLVPQADRAISMLTEAGIACYRTPESCAEAIRSWAETKAPRTVPAARVPEAAWALIEKGKKRWTERDALELFGSFGIPCVEQAAFATEDILNRKLAAEALTFPVVAKLLSGDLPHKTEAGAVALGIQNIEDLRTATEKMIASAVAYAPQARIEGVLVQRQRYAVAEILLGIRRDPSIGPILTIGIGGTATEIYRDITVRLAPVTAAEATEMLEDLKGIELLRGFRGRPRGDLTALAHVVAQFSHLAAVERLTEAEINPILVMPEGQGVIAVDGLVIWESI